MLILTVDNALVYTIHGGGAILWMAYGPARQIRLPQDLRHVLQPYQPHNDDTDRLWRFQSNSKWRAVVFRAGNVGIFRRANVAV